MSIYPVITKGKQELYEKIYLGHIDLQNSIPEICGHYGRACRNMDSPANSMLCNGCTLSLFVSTIETIIERCNEKEAIGIKSLYNSDILDIKDALEKKCIHVDYSYIENVLNYLAK